MNFSRAEFGQYPQDWSISTLGEYLEVLTDYHANGAYKKLKENVELLDEENYSIMIRTTNFEQNDFSLKSFKYINEHAYNFLSKTKVYQNDILMNKIANAGSVYLMPKLNKPVSLAMNLFLIRFNENVIMQKYAYYFMKNYEAYIKTRAQGSVTKTITKENVRKLEIAFPDIEEQTIIVKTLSDIDEKIETNNQINKKLEEMAQAIFKQWFVDFEFPNEDGEPYKSSGGEMVESEMGMIPSGWKVVSFLDDIDVLSGGTPKTTVQDYWNGEIPFFTPKDSKNMYCINTEKSLTEMGLNKCNSKLYDVNTVFITARGTVGKISIAGLKMAMNQSCYALIGKNNTNQYFVYFQVKKIADELRGKASGSVFDAIVVDTFKVIKILKPQVKQLEHFKSIMESIFSTILDKNFENQRLDCIRNLIIPKLMSGEIRVPLNN
ncbi:restriction endonuclease subunit S [Clostridium diolis]|uniref:restriction endonuclease subunit S n=1 Tax=Clostridium diolis TaxID=223919 RepID=UPI003AF8AF8D